MSMFLSWIKMPGAGLSKSSCSASLSFITIHVLDKSCVRQWLAEFLLALLYDYSIHSVAYKLNSQ